MITIFAGGGEKEQRKESRWPVHTTQHQTSYGVQSAWPRKCGRWKFDDSCRGKFMRWYEWLHSDVRQCNQYWCNMFWPSGSRFYGLYHKPQNFTVAHVSYKLKINVHICFILIPVLCIFYYFVQWPTNAQLIDKLSHSYMFWHYCDIFRGFVVSTLPSYTGMSIAVVGNIV